MLFPNKQITILCPITRKFFKFSVQKIFLKRFSCIEVICYNDNKRIVSKIKKCFNNFLQLTLYLIILYSKEFFSF